MKHFFKYLITIILFFVFRSVLSQDIEYIKVPIDSENLKNYVPVGSSLNTPYSYSQSIYPNELILESLKQIHKRIEANQTIKITSLTYHLAKPKWVRDFPKEIDKLKLWCMNLGLSERKFYNISDEDFSNDICKDRITTGLETYFGLKSKGKEVVYNSKKGTVKVVLDKPFEYDMSKHLVIEVYEYSEGGGVNKFKGKTLYGKGRRSIYKEFRKIDATFKGDQNFKSECFLPQITIGYEKLVNYEITINNFPVDTTICEEDIYAISGVSVSPSDVQVSWSGGKGEFSSTNTLNTFYTPSKDEVGDVTLTLTANKDGFETVKKSFVLHIKTKPSIKIIKRVK